MPQVLGGPSSNPTESSIAELYFCCAQATSWVMPVNVGAWKQERLPQKWQFRNPVCLVHG